MNFKSSRFFAALLAGGLMSAHAGAGEPPTDDEQLLIYELNRARNDPPAWASETGLALLTGGDGQLTTLVGVPPRPPLAVNETLVETARYRADNLATYNYFSHQNQDGRWPNQVVRDAGYGLASRYFIASDSWFEISSETDLIEAISAFYTNPTAVLRVVLRDEGDPELHHRKRFLGIDDPNFPGFYPAFREVGAGYAFNDSATYDHYWAMHVGFQQAGENAVPSDPLANFITGVVFDDANANDRYDSGEGLPGVEVAIGADTGFTNAAGGYAIQVADGSHVVRCRGGAFAGTSAVNVAIAGESREVDFKSGEPGGFVDFLVTVPEPGSGLLQAMALFTLLGLRRWTAHSG